MRVIEKHVKMGLKALTEWKPRGVLEEFAYNSVRAQLIEIRRIERRKAKE